MADPLSIAGGVLSIVSLVSLAASVAGQQGRELLNSLREEHPDSVIVFSFRSLQAERIESLQQKIIQLVDERQQSQTFAPQNDCVTFDSINKSIDESLQTYANALRNYETFSQEAVLDVSSRPSLVKRAVYRLFAQDKALKLLRQAREREQRFAGTAWSTQKYNFRELNREIRLERERKRAFTERLWMGAFGGGAVIGPMLLMVLHHDSSTSIVTACVATAIFTLVLTLVGTNLGGKDILAATAAYAAVLVVFVGTSTVPTA